MRAYVNNDLWDISENDAQHKPWTFLYVTQKKNSWYDGFYLADGNLMKPFSQNNYPQPPASQKKHMHTHNHHNPHKKDETLIHPKNLKIHTQKENGKKIK